MKTTTAKIDITQSNISQDLERLRKIYYLVDEAEVVGPSLLIQIGELIYNLTRSLKTPELIRNKYGYRNPADQNTKNKGICINFEVLGYLKHITSSDDQELLEVLMSQHDLLKISLNDLKDKVSFIISQETGKPFKSDLSDLTTEPYNFIETITSYFLDIQCIKNLLGQFKLMDQPWYQNLDLDQKLDRYALGYLIVEIGETTKTLSDFIAPEEQDGIKSLFTKLASLRNTIKRESQILNSSSGLSQIKLTLENQRDKLKSFLKNLETKLGSYKIPMNANATSHNIYINYHTFHEEFKVSQLDQIKDLRQKLKLKINIPKLAPTCTTRLTQIVEEIASLDEWHNFLAYAQTENILYTKAIKMTLGLLGEIYGQLSNGWIKHQINQFLLQYSMLAEHCSDITTIRNQEVMHNVASNLDLNRLKQIIPTKISAWKKDFQSILTCFSSSGNLREYITYSINLEDEQLICQLDSYSQTDQQIYIKYKEIAALNRLLQSHEAITQYEVLMKDLASDSNAELITSIHCQAALAYRNLGQFEQTITFLELALRSANKIQHINAKHSKLGEIYCYIAISYHQIDEIDKATEYLRLSTNYATTPLKAAEINLLFANLQASLRLYNDAKKLMEITFVKFFDDVLKSNHICAFAILETLANLYFENLDFHNMQDCLTLMEKTYTQYKSDFIKLAGQHVIYHEASLKTTTSKYHLIKAAMTEQSTEELEKIFSILIEEKKFRSALPYFQDKGYIDDYLLKTTILRGKKDDRSEEIIQSIDTEPNIQSYSLEEIQKIIRQIKTLVCLQFTKIIEYDKEDTQNLSIFVTTLCNTHKNEALVQFNEGNIDLAKDMVKKSILYKFIIDFFKNELAELVIVKRNTDSLATNLCFLDEQKFLQWQDDFNIPDSKLVNFLKTKFVNSEIRQDSIIQRYKEAKSDPILLARLIENLSSEQECKTIKTGEDKQKSKLDNQDIPLEILLTAFNEMSLSTRCTDVTLKIKIPNTHITELAKLYESKFGITFEDITEDTKDIYWVTLGQNAINSLRNATDELSDITN